MLNVVAFSASAFSYCLLWDLIDFGCLVNFAVPFLLKFTTFLLFSVFCVFVYFRRAITDSITFLSY